jgi:cytochrome c oxidase subunit 1
VQILENGRYTRAFSLHATVLGVLFVPALWAGLAAFVVPLQIGSNRVAFPRLLALSFWLEAAGALLLFSTYAMRGLGLPGITVAQPALAASPSTTAADLWIGAMALVAASTLLVALNLVVTIARLRAPGMTFANLPMFTWSVFAAASISILATPVFGAGLLLLYIDQHFGGTLFAAPGAAAMWQHTVWLFGRPEAYLLVLPGLGAACEIVAIHARRPLLSVMAARSALAAVAVLSLGAWAAGTTVARAIVVPTYSALTALTALPLGILALVWLGTLFRGRPRLHVSAVLVAAALLLFGFAALNAGIAAMVSVTGSAWTTGYLHSALFGPAVLLGAAALYHWAPKMFGRNLPVGPGLTVALLLTGGSLLNAGGSFLLGYAGAPAHVADLVGKSSWTGFSRMAAFGGGVLALGAVLLIAEVVRAAFAGPDAAMAADPYGGLSWEWTGGIPQEAQETS